MGLAVYSETVEGTNERFIEDARRSTWSPRDVAERALAKIDRNDPLLELTWNLASGSVYVEQVGLEAASVILTESPDAVAKLIGATAVGDEGRHSSVFAHYAERVGGAVAPPAEPIVDLSGGLLAMEYPAARMLAHTLLEGFAADEFFWFIRGLRSTGLADIYRLVRRDESRHVGLGMYYATRGGGLRGVRELEPEDLLAAEEFVVRYSDLDSIDGLVTRLLPGLEPGHVRRWMRHRHEKRMSMIFNVRDDRADLVRHRARHPVLS
ncbi:hypothetical protein GCM10023085_81960 [Actinomadura viridis]|uniref:Ferritin-like domain-containing protein n=1 Tax=Actinomadura viridis TaxID=58110 RepID=A0A931DPW0_9ACTN|nr:ferritin-like domain-containing protein [Actinomadura viridis]MBG6090548.1 hypothetical protein [Actinomadura viridis]